MVLKALACEEQPVEKVLRRGHSWYWDIMVHMFFGALCIRTLIGGFLSEPKAKESLSALMDELTTVSLTPFLGLAQSLTQNR